MSIEHNSPLPKRLKEARKLFGISQRALGMLAGIDESSASARMNQYEKGKHYPDFDMARRLANALKVPCSFFFEENDDIAEMLLFFFRLTDSERKKIKASLINADVDPKEHFTLDSDVISESSGVSSETKDTNKKKYGDLECDYIYR